MIQSRWGGPKLSAALLLTAPLCLFAACGEKDDPDRPETTPPGGDGDTSNPMGGEGGTDGVSPMDPCEDVTCPSGAECQATGNDASCVCEGDDCEGLVCAEDSCGDNATCTQNNNGFTCSCDEGFSGNGYRCVEGDLCSSVTCPGMGSFCATDGTTAACVCREGFEKDGNDCVDINECDEAGLCGTGATCVNSAGSYRCDCDPGFEDDGMGGCESAQLCDGTTACDALGMVCNDSQGSVLCTCDPGDVAGGTFCKATAACGDDSCNTGRCVETKGGFQCVCPKGTTGEFCEDTSTCSLATVVNADVDPLIEDATLRRIIENAAGVYDGSDVTVGDLFGVLHLYFGSPQDGEDPVSSLAGLECLPDLLSIDAGGHELTDLSPLQHHNQLETVDLACNPIVDLSPLVGKDTMRELELGNTCGASVNITDFSDVNKLVSLRKLGVSNHGISSDPGFSALPYLETLDVSLNGLDPLSDLGTMLSLDNLFAYGAGATSFTGIENFPALREVNVSATDISGLSGLDKASKLRVLIVEGLELTSLDGVTAAPQLRTLRAGSNSLTSAAGLAGSTTLVEANLSNNDIASVTDLAEASPLNFTGTIQLGGNPLDCDNLSAHEADLNAAGIFITSSCN